jgi:hypothetical protein
MSKGHDFAVALIIALLVNLLAIDAGVIVAIWWFFS